MGSETGDEGGVENIDLNTDSNLKVANLQHKQFQSRAFFIRLIMVDLICVLV